MANNFRPDGSEKFKVARVLIGALEVGHIPEAGDNVICPVYPCRVILINGEIWSIGLKTFAPTEEGIRQLWDSTDGLFERVIQ